MTETNPSVDPLDIIPDAAEIRRRLGATYRTARILRGLLRLADKRRDHECLTAKSESNSALHPEPA